MLLDEAIFDQRSQSIVELEVLHLFVGRETQLRHKLLPGAFHLFLKVLAILDFLHDF